MHTKSHGTHVIPVSISSPILCITCDNGIVKLFYNIIFFPVWEGIICFVKMF